MIARATLLVKNRSGGGSVYLGSYPRREDAEAAKAFVWALLGLHRDNDFYFEIVEEKQS